VDEHVLPTTVRGDEPVAPVLVEPLDDPDRHALSSSTRSLILEAV
jgi:hypothetical protein